MESHLCRKRRGKDGAPGLVSSIDRAVIVWHTRNREASQVYRAKERPFRQRPRVDWLCHSIKDWADSLFQWPSFDEAERAAARRIRWQLR